MAASQQTAPPPDVGHWRDRSLGNHRALVRVDAAATAVLAEIEWRRPDPAWENKGIVVTAEPDGKRVRNAIRLDSSTRTIGRVVFEPDAGPGRYAIYYMPVQPGQGNFPRAHYRPNVSDASPDWLQEHKEQLDRDGKGLARAEFLGLQARSDFDRFTIMEVPASAEETAALTRRYAALPFLVFAEDRRHPIAMRRFPPRHWADREPSRSFSMDVHPGETACFQLGVFAHARDLHGLCVRFAPATSPGHPEIPSTAFTCFNTEGISWTGKPFIKNLTVPAGTIQPLWCALTIPEDCPPGMLRSRATVLADDGAEWPVSLTFRVGGEVLKDHGDADPRNHSRLRWLNSTIALDDDHVPAPFVPLSGEGAAIRCLGREVHLGSNGFPDRIDSFFSGSNTHILTRAVPILRGPVELRLTAADGTSLPWRFDPLHIVRQSPGVREWNVRGTADKLTLDVHGRMEFDGWMRLHCRLEADAETDVRQVELLIPLRREIARYAMGMGLRGGLRPPQHEWTWDVARHQDSIWLGSINAGLRLQLRGANYRRPFVNIHYHHKPLAMPASWSNGSRGGCRFGETDDAVLLRAFSGPRTLKAGETLDFDFELLVTPFKPLNTEAQWRDRYYHTGTSWPASGNADLRHVVQGGATIVNVHQGNDLNPFINYPFLTLPAIQQFVRRAHQQRLRVKLYYTVRELTNHLPELYALRSLGFEVLADGPGGGHPWLEEHLGGRYIQAWYQDRTYDAAIITSGMSRWHNYYLEGLRLLMEQADIDGIYIDDVAFDRTIMKRVRHILDRKTPHGLIDLHSWNHFNKRAGYASCANLYMEHFPYIDRIWFGEGFDYNGSTPAYWLVEISGIPFGVMGEMLQGGGNLWLGQLFGMTNRLGWGGDPRPIWAFRDAYGIAGTDMIGFWDPACPAHTTDKDVLVTVYQRPGRTILAVANMSNDYRECRLTLAWDRLGINPRKADFYAPGIAGFQPESLFAIDDPIPVEAKQGWLFVVDEQQRPAPPQLDLTGDSAKLLLEETFSTLDASRWHPFAGAEGIHPGPQGLRLEAFAHHTAGVEASLPPGARHVLCEIDQGSDQGMTWGPGMSLLWPSGDTLKVNLRADGRYQVDVKGREHLVGHLTAGQTHRLIVVLGPKTICVAARSLSHGARLQRLFDLPADTFPGEPNRVRLGKTAHGAAIRNHTEPGPPGYCTIRAFRVAGAP